MHVSDVHDYGQNEEAATIAKNFLDEGQRKGIKDEIALVVDIEFDRLADYGEEFLSTVAANRAERFLEKVLEGDEDAAKELISSSDGDRYRSGGHDDGKPWASLIHGRLFETGGIALRRKIVETHADLIAAERIADLESIVDGLSQQIKALTHDLEECRNRNRNYCHPGGDDGNGR